MERSYVSADSRGYSNKRDGLVEAGYAGMHLSDWVYLYAAEESLEYGRRWNDWIVHDRDFFS